MEPQKSEAIIFTRNHKIRDLNIEYEKQKTTLKISLIFRYYTWQ